MGNLRSGSARLRASWFTGAFSGVAILTAIATGILYGLPSADARGHRGQGGGLDSRCVPSFGEQKLLGMKCTEIKDRSILHKAGVQSGDIVISVDGKPTLSPRDMMAAIRGLKEADRAEVKILRAGKAQTLSYVK